jgi:indolepyruvate ferredoxin oxidoreductase alpha subunit
MKHVGLNVAADPLFTASYTGVNGGLVICVADDPMLHSSQNEQDSRHYARASKTMMLEPADSMECKEFVKHGFELSERFDVPVLIRLHTRVCHSRTPVELFDRVERPLIEYKKDAAKWVMAPANARPKHPYVEDRIVKIREWANGCDLNKIIRTDKRMNGKNVGVIAGGVAYQYAKEALGDNASFLKLATLYPLPDDLFINFANSVDECWVIEELDPYIEDHCRKLGLKVKGKENFTLLYEYTAAMVRKAVLGEDTFVYDTGSLGSVPPRPPVMCPGCSHRPVFKVLGDMKLIVSGDIGCYTLGAFPPLNAMDTCIDMGAAISVAHGMEKAGGRDVAKRTVAVIGDSTFVHSGITSLIDVVYNKGTTTTLIVDNSTTGMTGHQDHPGTGSTIKGEPTVKIDWTKLCEAIGIKRVVTVDAFDMQLLKKVLTEELAADEPSVIIAQRPCALLKYVKHGEPFMVNDKCKACGLCIKIGCPAISKTDGKFVINQTQCVGCGCCRDVCTFGAIEAVK